jgi:hypothetical protein
MKLPLSLMVMLMFTSIFGYGSGTLELRIRTRQKFRILVDPDPQHCCIMHNGTLDSDKKRPLSFFVNHRYSSNLCNFIC